MAKLSKKEVNFEHPSTKGRQTCGSCRHFEVMGPRLCEIVEGRIMPGDWCKKYAPR